MKNIFYTFFIGLTFSGFCLADSQIKMTAEDIKFFKTYDIEIRDPHENKLIKFKGIKTEDFLNKNFAGWSKTKNLEFVCSDGYKPLIATASFKKYTSYLAYKRLDQKEFTIQNPHQNEQNVNLAPFYLVWENWDGKLKKEIKLEGVGLSFWPYQVVGLNSVDSNSLKKLEPGPNSSSNVLKGFATFKNQCLACHTLNGVGGQKAPELNYPTNITEYLDKKWIRKWIRNSTAIRFNSTMPEFSAMSDETLEDLIAYLESMRSRKIR